MQLYIALFITAILYIHVHCRKPKLPIDMEYALKAEDIGNGAVSENTPQNDDGSDCVHIDCDRKNDGEDNNDGDTKRGDRCDEYKYHECVDGDRKVMVRIIMMVIQKEVMDVMSIMNVSMVIERVMVRIKMMVI